MQEFGFSKLTIVERNRLVGLARSSKLRQKLFELPPIEHADRGGRLPLSYAQQRLWFLAQMEEVSRAYHVPFSLRFSGDLDRAALRRALDRIVFRHEALRTTFIAPDGEAVQRITPRQEAHFHMLEHDLRQREDREAELERLAGEEASAGFDLERGPLIRGQLIRMEEEEHVLLLTMHHIVSDGWSMGIFRRELSALYGAFLRGEEDPLPPLKIQYADYALWQRRWIEGEILQQQGEYWKGTLAGVPASLDLPTDYARPTEQNYAGGFVDVILDEQLTAGLRKLSRRHGTTLFMTLLAGWATLLSRLSGQQDIISGSAVANRGRVEIEDLIGLIGFFVNTLALRIDLSGSPTVGELLARVKAQAIAAQQHRDIPFEQVVELVRPVRSLAHTPIFQVMFDWDVASEERLSLSGLQQIAVGTRPYQVAQYDLRLALQATGSTIRGNLTYARSLFEVSTVERYLGYFRNLLEAMVSDDSQTVDCIPLLPAAERQQLLYEWNDTRVEYPSDRCVHELFEQQVEQSPEAVAVVFEEQELSYSELNRRANQLAHHLRGLGVGPDDRVAICVERSFEMIVGLLAVLKAGGAYVPLDPAYPADRLRFMLEDSAPKVLLTQSGLRSLLPESLAAVELDNGGSVWSHCPSSNPGAAEVGLTPQHLAYVIYTSGSTGLPKGVMVEHRNLTNYLIWASNHYALKRATVSSSLSFDATITSIYGPLACGGVSHFLQAREGVDALYLRLRAAEDTGLIKITPAHLDSLGRRLQMEDRVAQAMTVVIGGEALSSATARLWHKLQPNICLMNEYGPTETVVGCTVYELPKSIPISRPVPIGRPIANTQVYILDGHLQPVPVGVRGELYIGGAGVARGYLKRAELTAERFVADPFSRVPGARMYKTGDVGRWLADGNIEFLGRNDEQVKIRGFRIELGEIEARLAEHPGVREAVVVAREEEVGEKRLVAYYIATGAADVGAEELRTHLKVKLPEYMVPAAYVRLERLPLTPNGKLDRKALPAPDGAAFTSRSYEPPQGETETAIANIWVELLHVDRVGRHDNFFELGGHSLLAVQLIISLQAKLNVELDINHVFSYPALAELAQIVGTNSSPGLPPVVPVSRGEVIPLSYAQQRLWFLAQMEEVSRAYHVPFSLRFSGDLDRAALRRALDRIVFRHEALRTTFIAPDGEAVQRITPRQEAHFHMLEHDLRQREDREAELERLAGEEASAGFDLERGPLIRGQLIRMEEEEHVLLLTMHHIVSDGWSMGIFRRELSALYGAFLRGEEDPLPPLKIQYADYALWQRRWIEGEILQQQGEYWKGTLSGAPVLLELPADHSRPAQQDYAGGFVDVILDEQLTAGLRKLSRRHGTTLFMTLLAGWATLLSRLSGQQDIISGTPVANRSRAEIEELIGFFINTLALRIDLSGSPTVGELLARVKAQAIAAQQHQDIPFEQVVEIIQPVRSLSHSPLFQVMFVWENAAEHSFELPSVEVKPLDLVPHRTAQFDLTLSLQEAGGRILGGIEYATALWKRSTVERYLGYFRRLLEGMMDGEGQEVGSLSLLGEVEREQLLYGWNSTAREYPGEKCVQELFEEQVERTPEAVAVVYEDQQLTYWELNARANQLAHYLRGKGVKPDDRLAICVERSVEMVVGLLAILKAGGAYVPLDPAYPEERLRYMLEDSAPVVLLTQGHLQGLFAQLRPSPSVVDLTASEWNGQPSTNPSRGSVGLHAKHLAYVIYTSGSTGRPKGVMVEHRALVNHMTWMQWKFPLQVGEATLQKTPISFDASVWEFYAPLLVGGRLVMARPEGHKDPNYLFETICGADIQVLQVVPSLLTALVDAQGFEACISLRRVYCGGEPLPSITIQRFRFRLPRVELINLYGPTESTIDATYWICSAEGRKGTVPIGRPIANARVYILDAHGQPVPVGVTGELYIGGAGLARGYLNREELTAERFLKDPFAREVGARMYKTGDVGRWLEDGNIEFLGRNDEQVKIRGYRIELGEIESRLAEHGEVQEAVVVMRGDEPGEKRLVAYYTGSAVGAEDLRAHLAAQLPEYMMPAAYVFLEQMPLTANGKLDRKGLPTHGVDEYRVRAYEAPRGEIEQKLAAIWEEVLKVGRVGRHDNFFELGGHSLLAVTLIERMRRMELAVDVRAVFASPTLAELAASAREARGVVKVPKNRIPDPREEGRSTSKRVELEL